MFCRNCGKEVGKTNVKFCPYCREKIHLPKSKRIKDNQFNEHARSNNTKVAQTIIIAVAASVIVASLLYSLPEIDTKDTVYISESISIDTDTKPSISNHNEDDNANNNTENKSIYRAVVQDYETELYGFIDERGDWVNDDRFLRIFADDFSYNGIAVAKDVVTELFGCIDEYGEWVVEPIYEDWIGLIDYKNNPFNRMAKPMQDSTTGLWGLVKNEEWTAAPVFEMVDYQNCYFSDYTKGFIYARDISTHLWGIIDEKGDWIIEPRFSGDYHPIFSEGGLAREQDEESGLWGFIDMQGNWAFKPKFQERFDVLDFGKDGLALARAPNKFYGIINTSGNWVSEPRLHIAADVVTFTPFFSDNGLMALIERDTCLVGYINRTGNWEIRPQYHRGSTFNDINDPYDFWFETWPGVSE